MIKTEGSIVDLHPYRETSLLVHWCTRDHGLVKTLARGGRARKGPFGGRLDLFVRAELDYLPSRRSDLHVLREIGVKSARLGLRQSYPRTLAAAYFVKLIAWVAEPECPILELHDLLERALDFLSQKEPNMKAILFFEKETAKALGLGKGDIRALSELYGRVPPQRSELLRCLG